jgi:S-adenosylmethionine synthetase
MVRNIVVESLKSGIKDQQVEIVERKGIGHPDTICDAICESSSSELSKYYHKNFGRVLHHNVDKALLIAGKSQKSFLGGKIIKPIRLIISGRATENFNGKKIPVKEILIRAAKNYLKENLKEFDEENWDISAETESGSADLCNNFLRNQDIPLANDTSFGVGFAPFSEIEQVVLKASDFINSKEFRKKYPAVGEDTKVMGTKKDGEISLFVAIAFIDKYIKNLEHYTFYKDKVQNEIKLFVKKNLKKEVFCQVNSSDACNSIEDLYLTVTGTSAENGDDGQVGRGNRITGLITPNRPMTLEAAAGKNPSAHTGKVYSVLAQIIASDIYRKLKVEEVNVRILSQIGKSIDKPAVCSIQVLDDLDEKEKKEIYRIADAWLADIRKVTSLIIDRKVRVY